MDGFEITLASVALGALVVYHLVLWWEVRRTPARTSMGHAAQSRWLWVQSVMHEQRDILAVQTLRNWSMASSFLASTAVLLTIGLLGLLSASDKVVVMLHKLNYFGSTDETLFTFKALLLVLCFLTAFFNFSLALRYFNHVSLEIAVPITQAREQTPSIVISLFNRGAFHYTVGMRAYYLTIPMTLWFFGPAWMLAAAAVLVIALYRLDHLPNPPTAPQSNSRNGDLHRTNRADPSDAT